VGLRKPLLTACVGACLALLAPPGRADEGRYQDYVVGARAMGLGGAFTAIADDSSGIFYNPAGIVDVGRARLSISTNLYGLELRGADPITSATARLDSGFSAADLIIVPSSTGAVMGVGESLPNGHHRHAVGFGTQVPQYTSRFRESTGERASFSSRLVDRSLHAGAGYGFRASPWLRIGAGAHYILRTLDTEENLRTPGLAETESAFRVVESSLRSTQHSARLIVGAKVRPGPRWSLGLSLLSPSLGLWRTVDFESVTIDAREGPPELVRTWHEVEGWDSTSQIPGSARLGAAFSQPGEFTVSVDVIGYLPSRYTILEETEVNGNPQGFDAIPIPLTIDRGPLINVNAGIEKLLSPDISIAVGGWTNFTSAPEHKLERGSADRLADDSTRMSNVHMFGAALALGFFQEHSLHRLGLTLSTGTGDVVRQVGRAELLLEQGAPPLVVGETQQTFLYVFWSSSFRYGEGRTTRDFGL
jgi:hypothetical protein